jgi:hypothetical protein
MKTDSFFRAPAEAPGVPFDRDYLRHKPALATRAPTFARWPAARRPLPAGRAPAERRHVRPVTGGVRASTQRTPLACRTTPRRAPFLLYIVRAFSLISSGHIGKRKCGGMPLSWRSRCSPLFAVCSHICSHLSNYSNNCIIINLQRRQASCSHCSQYIFQKKRVRTVRTQRVDRRA